MATGSVHSKLPILEAILHIHYNPNDYLCPDIQPWKLQVTVFNGFGVSFCRINGDVFESVCASAHMCTSMWASNTEMAPEASNEDKYNKWYFHLAVMSHGL